MNTGAPWPDRETAGARVHALENWRQRLLERCRLGAPAARVGDRAELLEDRHAGMEEADGHLGVLAQIPVELEVVGEREHHATGLLAGGEDLDHEIHEAGGAEAIGAVGLEPRQRLAEELLEAGVVAFVGIGGTGSGIHRETSFDGGLRDGEPRNTEGGPEGPPSLG